jgi:hypothetical protein
MTLAMLFTEMKEPEAGKSYFAACLSADQAGTAEWSVFTGWVRTKSQRPAIEIRQASAVVPTIQISQWVKLGQGYTILAKQEHLFMFYQTGGNALIEASFAAKRCLSCSSRSSAGDQALMDSCQRRTSHRKRFNVRRHLSCAREFWSATNSGADFAENGQPITFTSCCMFTTSAHGAAGE